MSTSEKPSKTAELVAAVRAAHTRTVKLPIFTDEFAKYLIGTVWRTISGSDFLTWLVLDVQLKVIKPIIIAIFVRARFCEDLVQEAIESGIDQYVILGAGYDSFGMRRTDLNTRVTVFEVDQLATQTVKLQRMEHRGISNPTNVRYVAVDFNKDDMFERLIESGYDKSKPTVFSWFGVTYYLPTSTLKQMLNQISTTCAPGSSILFDFQYQFSVTPKEWRHAQIKMCEFVEKKGEPMMTRFGTGAIEEFVQECGFTTVDTLTSSEVNQRFLSHRSDNLTFPPIFGLCSARID